MKTNKALSIISGVMLVLAIPAIWPYGYYELLRWVVSLTGIFNAYQYNRLKLQGGTIFMILVAILFNPIAPITFAKETWVFFDFITAIIMFAVSSEFKKEIIK